MFREGPRRPRGGNSWQSRRIESAELNKELHCDGSFVYVVDATESVYVVPDGPHRHPEVLGNGDVALYAGELTTDDSGRIIELNNLSGTFQFKTKAGLLCVAEHLIAKGFTIDSTAISFYDPNGEMGPEVVSLL